MTPKQEDILEELEFATVKYLDAIKKLHKERQKALELERRCLEHWYRVKRDVARIRLQIEQWRIERREVD